MDKALSLDEINKITGKDSLMITYPELQNFDNIYDIFEDFGTDHFILLYQTSDNFGHWCLCFIRPNTKNKEIEFYDPYGDEIDKNLSHMKDYYKKISVGGKYEYFPHLTRLLLNTPNDIKIHYNDYKHQKLSPGIATCGRHVAWRLLHNFMDIDQYSNTFGKRYIDKDIVNFTDYFL